MIRDSELERYLECISTSLSTSIRPAIEAGPALKTVDSLNLVLGRLLGELKNGSTVVDANMTAWRKLAESCPVGDAQSTDITVSWRPMIALDTQVSEIQHNIEDPKNFETLISQIRNRNPDAMSWIQESADILNRTLQQSEDGFFHPEIGEAKPEDRVIDATALKRRIGTYLSERFPELPSDCVETLKIVPGGQVKLTAIFQLIENDVLPRRLVLRQDQEFNITGAVITDEYEVLKKIAPLGLPFPEAVLLETDATKLDGQFLLMKEFENTEAAGTYFVEERRLLGSTMGPSFGDDVARVLAGLHRGTEVASGSEESDDSEAAIIAGMEIDWRGQGRSSFSIAIALCLAWLKANPLSENRPRAMIHVDMGAHNMLTRDGRLAALLDWELARYGDPAEDLAQTRMMLLPDTMPWPEFKAAYLRHGGSPEACDERAVAYFAVRTFLKHGLMNMRMWEYFITGQRADAPAASIASHFIERLMLYLARTLKMAIEAETQDAPQSAELLEART